MATHGRVPGDRCGQTALNSRGQGRGNPRSRAFNSLAAEALARAGEPGAASGGLGVGGSAGRSARQERDPHGPSGLRPRAPPGSRGARGASSPASQRSSPASSACASPPHRLRLPLPSPASRAPCDADFGRTPEEAGSFLSSAREPFPLRAPSLCLLLLHFSVPDAAAASCHHPSSQHGGGGGSCWSASRGPAESTAPPPLYLPRKHRPRPPSPHHPPFREHRVRHYGDHPRASREM